MQQKAKSQWQEYTILFLLGLIVIFLRSAYTVVVPTLYTEDGVWTGVILEKGFFYSLFNVRPDYLVSGNIILLGLSLLLNTVFCGKDLTYYPYCVTAVQYLFYSAVALLPYVCFKDVLRKSLRLFLWGMTILVPLGMSGFEVFGKISNIGFLCYNITFYLLFFRITRRDDLGKITVLIIDTVLLICCATHPGCYVLVGLGFVIDVCLQYQQIRQATFFQTLRAALCRFSNISWILLGCSCCILFGYDLFVLTSNPYEAMATQEVPLSIEFLARGLIFYFIYPMYHHLNDKVVIVIFAILFGYYLLGFLVRSIDFKLKRYLAVSLLVWLFYFLITAIARKWMLVPILQNYTTTYADRYYYGINILSLFPFVITLEIILRRQKKFSKVVSYFILLYMLALPIADIKQVFRNDTDPITWTHIVSFEDRLKQANYDSDTDKYIVPIDSEPLTMQLPRDYYLASIQRQRNAQPFTVANFTDENWTQGVGTSAGHSNRLLFTWESKELLSLCDTLIVGIQEVHIQEVVDNGQWLHVVCDTTELSNFAYPNEIAFTLKGDTEG